MFDIFLGTATEIKRDKYKKLYDKLVEAIADHEEKVAEAEASYNSYITTVPNLSNSKIPSNDFDPKREEKNAKLLQYFEKDKDKKKEEEEKKKKEPAAKSNGSSSSTRSIPFFRARSRRSTQGSGGGRSRADADR